MVVDMPQSSCLTQGNYLGISSSTTWNPRRPSTGTFFPFCQPDLIRVCKSGLTITFVIKSKPKAAELTGIAAIQDKWLGPDFMLRFECSGNMPVVIKVQKFFFFNSWLTSFQYVTKHEMLLLEFEYTAFRVDPATGVKSPYRPGAKYVQNKNSPFFLIVGLIFHG